MANNYNSTSRRKAIKHKVANLFDLQLIIWYKASCKTKEFREGENRLQDDKDNGKIIAGVGGV